MKRNTSKRLRRSFYLRPTLVVARDLLGKYLTRRTQKGIKRGKIVEVEAYIGPYDRASHAWRGKVTKRNRPVYLIGGYTYIYLCYGIYWMLNLVTQNKKMPECVLIRAVEPITNKGSVFPSLTNGPGKLCRWLEIDGTLNEEDLVKSKRLWVEEGNEKIKKSQIVSSKRIGIDYAKEWAQKPWRFYLKDNIFVSRK